MDCEQRHEVQQWLLKSQRDLEAARRLFSGEDPLLDIVVYHCQQSAEKALKAYLCYCDAIINKTHNLNILLEYCQSLGMNINELWICAETLTPYATEFRYPGDLLEPEKEDAEEAIEMATQIYSFVLQNLPSDYNFFVPS